MKKYSADFKLNKIFYKHKLRKLTYSLMNKKEGEL
jgi:hypothetical protein